MSTVTLDERPFQLLPPLDAHQFHLLRESIRASGVLEPVVFDEDGEILDGHHRVQIAEELGIDYPRRVIDDLDRPGKHMYALTVNVARRQLDQEARADLVGKMRLRGMSIRGIADALGVPKTTVARDVAQLSHSGQLEQPERITGADGKDRPASRPAPEPPADLRAAVLAKLPKPAAEGLTIMRLSKLIKGTKPADIRPFVDELVAAGEARRLPGENADRYTLAPALTRMLPETAEPVAAPDVPAVASGSGPTSPEPEPEAEPKPTPPPGSPAAWTPEEQEANRLEIERKASITACERVAESLVLEITGMVTTIIDGLDSGAPGIPVSLADIDACRAALDRLEERVINA